MVVAIGGVDRAFVLLEPVDVVFADGNVEVELPMGECFIFADRDFRFSILSGVCQVAYASMPTSVLFLTNGVKCSGTE